MKSLVSNNSVGFAVVVAALFMGPVPIGAQEKHDHEHGEHDEHEHSTESLAFSLPKAKNMHFEDAAKAEKHLKTVQQLGCRARMEKHDGHIDVTYQCEEWKTLEVTTHELGDKWSQWLKDAGFDVAHGHIAEQYLEGKEAVEFRLVKFKTIHGDGSDAEVRTIETLQSIGCDVRVNKHAGHSDIAYRSPVWNDIHVASHADAAKWIEWLDRNGFETRHEH